jgi:hypothetical protein
MTISGAITTLLKTKYKNLTHCKYSKPQPLNLNSKFLNLKSQILNHKSQILNCKL